MPLFERLRKVDVRAVLRSLKCGESVTFQLRPREFLGGRWQGGTFLSAKRLTRRFLIGSLMPMSLKEAVEYVHAAFDGYHTPRVMETDHDPSADPVRRSREVPQRAAHRRGQDPDAEHRQRQPEQAAETRGNWWG